MTQFCLQILFLCIFRFVQIAVASFGSNKTCATSPGGFSRLSYDVLQWIQTIKVYLQKKSQGATLCLKVDSWQHKVNREMSEIQKKNSDVKTEMSELQEKNSDMKTEMSDLKQRNQEQHAINSNMNREMSILKQKNQEQQSRMAELSHTGSWCAYQDGWTSRSAVIKYDKIMIADSNMNGNALNSGNGEL